MKNTSSENSNETSSTLTNEDKVKLLRKSIHKSTDPSFLTQIKPDNPNYLEIIECNDQFLKCFDLTADEVLGNNYDFLMADNNLDYESEEYFKYAGLIKAVKNLKVADIKINIHYPKDKNKSDQFKVKFIPSRYKTEFIYCVFVFEKTFSAEKNDDTGSVGVVQNIERALRNERLIRSLVDIIASGENLIESANDVVKSICQYLKVDRCILHDIEDGKIGFVVESCGSGVAKMSDSKNAFSRYIDCQKHIFADINRLKTSNSVLVYEDMSSSQFAAIQDVCKDFKIGSQMIVNMTINNAVNGGIYIHQSTPRQWILEEIELIEILAYQFAIAIDRISNINKLKKSLEEEKRMRQMQAEFVAMVSHEFKTPLQIIDGARELVSRKLKTLTVEDEQVNKSLDRVKSGILRMNNLIQSTLNLSKMEMAEGGIKAVKQDFDIKHLINDIIDKNSHLINEKHITIEADLERLPVIYNGDQKLLDHCFTNIIGNAVKYSRSNSSVKIVGDVKDKKLIIKVIDSGIGIPKEDIDQIGTKFFRAKNTLSVAGTGIGLYLTKYFIELHKGSVLIESELNVGTTISVFLPN